jgi:drug/metabolite transporter (DMT)-like permease
MTWLVATLVAACFQVARTAMQQGLRGAMGPNAAGFVRYVFGAPLALGAIGVIALSGTPLPVPPLRFLPLVAGAGLAQIAGTNLLIRAFALRDFAVGTTYAKTEAAQVAVFSALLLGEPLPGAAWSGIALCLAGVVVLAAKGDLRALRTVVAARGEAAMWAGLGAAAGFGAAAVLIRASSRSLGSDGPIVRALVTLACMNTFQAVVNGGWLALKAPTELRAVRARWRHCVTVGALSVGGSAGWAIAMTLKNAAVVRAVGQIDVVLAFVVARLVFHEERRRSEVVASAVIVAGVVVILITG